MHPAPRTIYDKDVDFTLLALHDADFKSHLKSNGQLDFSDPAAVKFNYILWIQDLLDTTNESYDDRYDPNREVVGLDMFVTLPLCLNISLNHDVDLYHLNMAFKPNHGCAQRERWRFVVTGTKNSQYYPQAPPDKPKRMTKNIDIDDKNLSHARQNILANNLKSRIRPLLTKPEDSLIPLDALGLNSITFTICNPPFYSSPSDLLTSAAAKSRPPHSACTGAPIEMVTQGGEVAFVTRMINESEQLRERCQWYTTMLGKFSSVGVVVEGLKERGVGNWAVKEFVQGEKTRRWGVGWSWGRRRPREDVARGVSTSIPKHLLPFPSEFKFEVPTTCVDFVGSKVNMLVEDLDLQWQYRAQISTGVGFTRTNVWSRAARRQKKRDATHNEDSMGKSEDEVKDAALGFKIQLAKQREEVVVTIRWLQGSDSVLFESFCGMMKRQIASWS
ncbi:MAG: hypothetical protein Q9213_006436 [Squamulea squamosa]